MGWKAGIVVALAIGQAEPAVTVTAPDRVATVAVSDVEHWARAERRGSQRDRETAALRLLISSEWVDGEAREREIVVTAQVVRNQFERQIDETFRSRAAFRRWLRRNRVTRADMLWRARVDTLERAIKGQITQAAAIGVTQEQIDAYVQSHPREEPEERAVRVVLTKTRQQARKARSELERGRRWRTVARRYSIDAASRDRGGLYHATAETLPVSAGRAAISAPKGALVGPVKTRFGYFVLKVVRITPAHPAPLDQQRATAWEVLASAAQEQALRAYRSELRTKWRARTRCAPAYAWHADCGPG